MPGNVDLYNTAYGNSATDAYREIRIETYGEDFGQTSWVATGEFHQIPHYLTLTSANDTYDLTHAGTNAFASLGIDVAATRNLRRRFAYACLDWSERQPHIGGALGAALLRIALKRKWVVQELDSRALSITSYGRREIRSRFGLQL